MRNPFSGITLKDFIPPIIEKIMLKVENQLNVKLKSGPRGLFQYVPAGLDIRWMLDLGAADGAITRAALDSFPDCKVVCFEPVSATFEQLKSNLARYGGRVVFYNLAVGDYSGKAEINITSSKYANSLKIKSELYSQTNPQIKEIGKEEITVVSLDSMLDKMPVVDFDLVKIDVEGFEQQVLRGGNIFFRNHVDTVIIEVSLARDDSWEHQSYLDIFSILNEYGFRLVNVYDVENSTRSRTSKNLMLSQMDCVFRHISKLK